MVSVIGPLGPRCGARKLNRAAAQGRARRRASAQRSAATRARSACRSTCGLAGCALLQRASLLAPCGRSCARSAQLNAITVARGVTHRAPPQALLVATRAFLARSASHSLGPPARPCVKEPCAAGAALYYVVASAATGRASGLRPRPLAPTRTCGVAFSVTRCQARGAAGINSRNGTEAPGGFEDRDGAEPRRGERRARSAQLSR